jgi:hypothetical protein
MGGKWHEICLFKAEEIVINPKELPMSQALSVSLERKGTVIDVNYDTTALQNIHVDLNEVAEDDRSGRAKKLLGASVLYCYTAALDKALDVRGAKYDAIKGRATVTAGTDDKGRPHPRHYPRRHRGHGLLVRNHL